MPHTRAPLFLLSLPLSHRFRGGFAQQATQKLVQYAALAGLVFLSGMFFAARAVATESEIGEQPSAIVAPTQKEIEKSSVITSVEIVAERTPGSAQSVSTSEIREHAHDDVNRVLRKVPGVIIREEDGNGLFPNLSLRGVDTNRSSKVTIMEDGVLQAPAPYSAPAAYYSPTVGRMSGLEILKGSSQVQYGPHTTGGVINYRSTPIPHELTTYLKGVYSEYNEYRLHFYQGNRIKTDLGHFGYVIETYGRHSDGFKEIDESSRSTGFKHFEPMLKLSWEPNTDSRQIFEFKYGYTSLTADETYLGLTEDDFDDDPYRRYRATKEDQIRTKQYRTHLRHSIQASDTLKIDTTVYYNQFARNWFKLRNVNGASLSAALAGVGGGANLATLRGDAPGTWGYRHNNRDYYSWGVQSVLGKTFDGESIDQHVKFGMRYHEDQEKRFEQDQTFTVDGTGKIVSVSSAAPGGANDRQEETRAVATFLQDEIRAGAWSVTPGIRWERLRFNYANSKTGARDSGGLHLLSGGVGVTYDLDEETQIFGGFHRGASSPNPTAHLQDNIPEEKAYATELGVRYKRSDGALVLESTAFHTRFKDLLVVGNIGGGGSPVTESVGEADVMGLELSVTYDLGVARGWSFQNPYFLAATYTHAELRGDSRTSNEESIFAGGRDGNQVPYVPLYTISGGSGVQFARWGFEVTGTYVDEAFTTADNTSKQVNGVTGGPDARFGKTDNAFIVDVMANMKLRDRITLSGGIKNIGDREYVVSRHPEGPRPGKPRTAWLGLEFSY